MEDTILPSKKDLGTDIHDKQNLSPNCAALCPYILDRNVVSTNFLSTIQLLFILSETFLPGHLKEEIFGESSLANILNMLHEIIFTILAYLRIFR